LDDLCNTVDPLGVGVSEQLHDGRVHPYFARRRSNCAGVRPRSEAITLSRRSLVYILKLQSYDCISKDRRREMKKVIFMTMLMVFGLALFSGCASMTGRTAGKHIDDASINTEANSIIVKDPDAQYLKIDVTSTDGNVVLQGFIHDKKAEDRIVAKIREIKGVKSVKSLLKVEPRK
jgi:hypothetical protein